MKQAEEFLILMQTVHLKTLLNGFLYLGCGFLLGRNCQANLLVENQKTLVPGWPVNLVGGGGVGGGGVERRGHSLSSSAFPLCVLSMSGRGGLRSVSDPGWSQLGCPQNKCWSLGWNGEREGGADEGQ